VITADDGHESVFTEMAPLVREYGVPVTLFIYPSAISNAPYAMTWEQLAALDRTGLFGIESHTYWHPNFKTEKRRLSAGAYRALRRSN
jgi:peptidoglycan/xylan/chitin deacetylase (PgdA/CDA1 family)